MKNYFRTLFRRFRYGFSFTVLILLFLLIVLWDRIVHVVPQGHEAVVWHSVRLPFLPADRTYLADEGVELIWPWDKFYLYDVRLLTHTETYQVVSREGLHFDVDMTFRWNVVKEHAITLNQEVGQDYLNRMLIPEVGSRLREIVATYRAEALYTVSRNEVQRKVFEEVVSGSHPNHIGTYDDHEDEEITIILLDTLMTSVKLPQSLQDAIENKLAESEMVAQYEFRVERERLESQRKQIEAEGIRNFQETVAPAITDSYLQWRGIEATVELAKSNNSKVVVIGNSANGLPLILDTQEGRLTPSATSITGPAIQE